MRADQMPSDLGRSPTVLVLIDFINPLDFDGGEDLAPFALKAAQAAAELKSRVLGEGGRCIYANDNYGTCVPVRGYLAQVQVRGRRAGLPAKLKPGSTDLAVLKPRHSAFYCTPLNLILSTN